jgi:putative hydrolase of the HAD superfamily
VPRALLFDLDETLVVEEEAVAESFAATARAAAERRLLDAATLARDARSCARELWRAAPTHPYCARIGISSWEGLCCRFEGDGPQLEALRAWAPSYRRRAWADALACQGIDDPLLAEDLGERLAAERRARHAVFDDAASALTSLGQSHALALVTNGASCLQREKLAASGLGEHFDAVVVSGDVGAGKPDAAIFRHALAALDASAGEAVMIGDNLERDVDGAIAVGLEAVWINRRGDPRPEDRRRVVEIATLAELSAALAR